MEVGIRYFGSKAVYQQRINALMPDNSQIGAFVDLFGGIGKILMGRKQISNCGEVFNDTSELVHNFFMVLQNPKMTDELASRIEFMPYSRKEFESCFENIRKTDCQVEKAYCFLVVLTQNRTPDFLNMSFKNYVNTYLRHYLKGPRLKNYIHAIAYRFQDVSLESSCALKLIRRWQHQETFLFYADPPYFPESRVSHSHYENEPDADFHIELLELLKSCKGAVAISGYANSTYDEILASWNVKEMPVHGASYAHNNGQDKKEILWRNKRCVEMAPSDGLF